MDKDIKNLDEEIKKFHLPRWAEIPEIDLYIDQVVSLLENYLSNYIKSDNEKENKVITKTMINNYVKHGIINSPINKKYNKEHIAYLFVIFILKQIYSIDEPLNDTGKEMTLQDTIGKTDNIDDLLILKEALTNLTPFEREIIVKRYMNDLTQQQTANELGMTQVQVSRGEQKILTKLKSKLVA